MLFNSQIFLFLFLPLSLLGYFAIWSRSGHDVAKLFLVLASLFFYGWWEITNLWIILFSICFNYLIGQGINNAQSKFAAEPGRSVLLTIGITFNLGLIGFFKYTGFGVEAVNLAFGSDFVVVRIVLPLAISFFTFQQISYLVDSHGGQLKSARFLDYALFVTFFPQLLAGPIVHYREMMPQFEKPLTKGASSLDLAVGGTLFLIGLFKKVVLADTIGGFAAPVFDAAASGGVLTLIDSWGAAIAFSLQLYFDFSGYSDMAVGLGRMFGIRLPLNFNSPYKAATVISFWSRWHMTLTRFLISYVYNPIVLRLTRRRIKAGKPVLSHGVPRLGPFLILLALPTVLTMFLSGLWHGAGFQFLIFGLLHGVFLVINHAWASLRLLIAWNPESDPGWLRAGWIGATFLSVTISLVLFRADDLSAATTMYRAMAGLNGVVLPSGLAAYFGWLDFPVSYTVRFMGMQQLGWTVLLLGMIWSFPNSQQLLSRYMNAVPEPMPASQLFYATLPGELTFIAWRPDLLRAVFLGGIIVITFSFLSDPSRFIYFVF